MYTIYVDNKLLYIPYDDTYGLISARLSQELNTAGSLRLAIPATNPNMHYLRLLKPIIEVFDDNRLIYRGRNITPSKDVYNTYNVICEGALAFLNDSYFAPYDYNGSVSEFLRQVLASHNAQVEANKQFKLGKVTVTNNTDSGSIIRSNQEYSKSWDVIKSKLFDSELKGYIWVRYETDGMYIDYLDDITTINTQEIVQGENLLSITEALNATATATVLLPLGAKIKNSEGEETDERVTIESVHGSIYLEDEEAIAEYGRIVEVIKHDDITEPRNLLTQAQRDIHNLKTVTNTLDISAVDLVKAGYDVQPFYWGSYIRVKVASMDIDKLMLIRKIELNLLDPAKNTISIGDSVKTFTQGAINNNTTIEQTINNAIINAGKTTEEDYTEQIRQLQSLIEQSTNDIRLEITETTYNKNDVNDIISQLSTKFQQDLDSFEFSFNEFQQTTEGDHQSVVNEFNDLYKYIRFVDGDIIIGRSDNEVILRMENDKISFSQNGVEILNLSHLNSNMEQLRINTSLQLGKFGFTPRSNGSLSFSKIED